MQENKHVCKLLMFYMNFYANMKVVKFMIVNVILDKPVPHCLVS